MTSIGAISSYSSYSANSSTSSYSAAASSAAAKSSSSSGTNSSSATNVTLSASAHAALSTKSFLEVISEARESLTGLIEDAGTDGPYKDGKLAIDLSGFDRRSLWAIAGNSDGTFSDDEIKAAGAELTGRFDAAMAGPFAVYKVTGNITKLYEAARTWFEDASAEEKTSTTWKTQSAAIEEALGQLANTSSSWPDVENDPVTDYISRVASGDVGSAQDFASLADSARTALDQQIAAAAAQGKSLNFSKYQKSGIKVDFSDFSSRALSAITLNQGDQFSTEEISAAREEISSRGRQVLMSCISSANSSSSPTAMAENIISAYSSLSAEELEAVGWNDTLYQAALANYKSASYIASMLDSSAASLLGASSSTSAGTGGVSSLASQLSSS